MMLQSGGIAEHRCSETLRETVEAITDFKIIGELPSTSTQRRIASEMKALALKKVVDTTKNASDLTMKYDGSTDSTGRHITEVEISTGEETYLIGMKQQVSGKAEDYVDSIMCSLDDVDKMAGEGEILKKVTNTMTDRHIVNTAVDETLEEKKGSEIHKFRCAMHPLDSFQKSSNKILGEEEDIDQKKYSHMPYTHRGESMTQALIRLVDKLFHDQSIAIGADLSTYLQNMGFSSSHNQMETGRMFLRWVGNKFNVLYTNASYVSQYAPHIVQYLKKVQPSSNPAAQAALNFLENGDCRQELRCLQLIGRYVAEPWMNLVGKEPNILELNSHFKEAHSRLTTWIKDSTDLLSGTENKDCFGRALEGQDTFLQDTEVTQFAKELLQHLLQGILDIMDRQLKDQLPGGLFWNPSQKMMEEAKSCTATNISGERKFALLKAKQAIAPTMTTAKIEQKIMFSANKVKESFLKKTKAEQAAEIAWATKMGRKIREDDKKRQRQYKEKMKAKLIESRKQLTEKEEKKRNDLEEIVNMVYKYGGYWADVQTASTQVKNLSLVKDKKAALKAQIKLQTTILKCKAEEKLALSKSSVDQLQAHLDKLIIMEVPAEMRFLEEILKKPDQVIHRKIQHKYEETDSGVEKVYSGMITTALLNEYDQQEFEIVYDDESDTPIYSTLEEIVIDLASGDMKLVPAEE